MSVQLNLAPSTASSHMPDVLQAYVFDHLKRSDLEALKLVSKGCKHFVEKKHRRLSIFRDPKHLGVTREQKDLQPHERLAFEFIKFQDRPIYQRIGIIIVCTLLSPVILVYHSPKIIKATYRHVICPIGRKIARLAEILFDAIVVPIARFTYDYVLAPIGRGIKKVMRFIGDNILSPLFRAVEAVARAIFITLPTKIYQILSPLGGLTRKALKFVGEHILLPIIEHIVIPILVNLWKGSVWIIDNVATPLASRLWKVIVFTFDNAVIPVAKIVKVIAKGLLVTFPYKIYINIIDPLAQGFLKVATIAYDLILEPLGRLIYHIASAIINYVILPATEVITFSAKVLYNNVLEPVGLAVITIPYIVGKLFNL